MGEIACEECGNDIASVWAYEMALCLDCAEAFEAALTEEPAAPSAKP